MSEHEDPFFAHWGRIWRSGAAPLPVRINQPEEEDLGPIVNVRVGARRQGKTLQQAREARQALAEGKTVYIPRRGPFGQIDGLQRVVDVVLPEDE